MAYVDLNPVRAGIAATPEDSDFTSIEARIKEFAQAHDSGSESTDANGSLRVPLLKFRGAVIDNEPTIPFRFCDYLELVDWTGRTIRSDKRGAIDSGSMSSRRLGKKPCDRAAMSSAAPWADSTICDCMRERSGRPGSERCGRPIAYSVTGSVLPRREI
jgi:hypothetical protein